jgi:hypothetical protein
VLPELSEQDASGDIAKIYDEIKTLCGVPYVSSLQRHLATRPGWLEWCWETVRPVFVSGLAQERAWQATAGTRAPALPAIPLAAQQMWGIDDDARATLKNIADLFVQVSPTNLAFSGIIRAVVADGANGVEDLSKPPLWQPPSPVPGPPPLVAQADTGPTLEAVLEHFSVMVDGHPFIPGLYRMLAHYPQFTAYLATTLAPRFYDAETISACDQVKRRVDESIRELVANELPRIDRTHLPPVHEHAAVLGAIERYRETSPQMIIFGRLIGECLPDADDNLAC